MHRRDFDYCLPSELIAQTPLAERSASRLLVLDPDTDKARDSPMRDFPGLLRRGDLLVFNDTRVVAARLLGSKPSGGRVEVFLERVVAERQALVQLRASKPIRAGLEIGTPGGTVRVIGREEDLWRVELPGVALDFFEQWGEVPLPPYIHRSADSTDRERYQSIFARDRGAVAAPTASLHFDAGLIREIASRGVKLAFVTLHVGAGTFQPLRTDNLDEHVMHAEQASVSTKTWAAIGATKRAGGRVVAVGTTVVRALESAALHVGASWAAGGKSLTGGGEMRALGSEEMRALGDGEMRALRDGEIGATGGGEIGATGDSALGGEEIRSTGGGTGGRGAEIGPRAADDMGYGAGAAWAGDTRLFIRPGFQFRVVDALLTNFHLPGSTLLMLVCAFAGTEPVLAAYAHAVSARYRFFSYGDAMFLVHKPVATETGKSGPGGTCKPHGH